VYTVSELTERIQDRFATEFADVWVRGEVSRAVYASSGHVYATLKDQGAVLDVKIWRSTMRRIRFRLEEGLEILARGRIDVYAPRGQYSLIASTLEPMGEGELRLAFEQLRDRLALEGLFAPERKQELPQMPRRVAVVTSPTGAAVRDLVTVMQRRMPSLEIVLVATRVQGEQATNEIAAALAFADAHAGADVIVVGRGGGSLEDLWCFNEEVVARAIAACRTPVVSAVGHETDTTIADLVADVRAATPSQAGELVVPDRADLAARLDATAVRLARRLQTRLDAAWQRVEALADRPVLREPQGILRERRERLAGLEARLRSRSPLAALRRRKERLEALAPRLASPLRRRIDRDREQLNALEARGRRAVVRAWRGADERRHSLEERLRALSPLAVLGRGYSLTRRAD
jgi:exodeoxyribonuclease VII large subunit